jgi:PPOX class probable F420-dependent enzyme
MDLTEAMTIVQGRRLGVLATQRAGGRPQLSNIVYVADADGTVRISVTEGRAKTANLRRTPLASLHVGGDDFWHYVVVDADVELSPVATAEDDATVDGLVELYRALQGEHDDWDEYRRAMVRDRRLVLRLTPTHAYGMWAAG